MSTFMVILPNNLIAVKYLAEDEITHIPQEITLPPWFNLPSKMPP